MNRFFTLLLAASCLTAVGQYQVGDVGPAGGWIFYVDSLDEFDWDYLEVASSYCPVACSMIGGIPNQGPDEEIMDLNDLRDIGMGEFNTTWAFENWLHQGGGQSSMGALNTATRVALMEVFAFRQNDFTDWFMPSIDELLMIYQALPEDITSSFSPDAPYASDGTHVWSSSPRPENESMVFGLRLSDHSQASLTANPWVYNTDIGILVLPIRAFSANSSSCGSGTVWDEASQTCVADNTESLCDLVYDGTGDGIVGAGDLLGLLTEYGSECIPETAFTCGDPVSYQGYDYETVQIGEQCWFAENLRSDYQDGDAIPSNLLDDDWENAITGAVSVYGQGESVCNAYSPNGDACDETWSLEQYGKLYNWYAVNDERGLCPQGWEVPNNEAFDLLIDFLGGSQVAGTELKSAFGWQNGGNGTDSSGFSAMPGGHRAPDGSFGSSGGSTYWWSSSAAVSESGGWVYALYQQTGHVGINNNEDRHNGLSIRCIKD